MISIKSFSPMALISINLFPAPMMKAWKWHAKLKKLKIKKFAKIRLMKKKVSQFRHPLSRTKKA